MARRKKEPEPQTPPTNRKPDGVSYTKPGHAVVVTGGISARVWSSELALYIHTFVGDQQGTFIGLGPIRIEWGVLHELFRNHETDPSTDRPTLYIPECFGKMVRNW